MKKIVCDGCGSENAKTYKYTPPPIRGFIYKDFCNSCLQDFVLKNQVKLEEVKLNDIDGKTPNKTIIYG
jgi:hypothetical protein